MAQRGRRFTFHGAFGSKAAAVWKERKVHGFIRPTKIKGHRRYMVLTRNPSWEVRRPMGGGSFGVVSKHRTRSGAEKKLRQEQRGARRQGGYSQDYIAERASSRRHRHNPESKGGGKSLAIGLLAVGALLLFRRPTVPVVTGTTPTGSLSSITGSLSSLWSNLSNLFGGGTMTSPFPIGGTTASPSPALSPAANQVLPDVASQGIAQYDSTNALIGYAFANQGGGVNIYDPNGYLIGTS